ncbi:nitrogen assimilation transcriptional regulator NAC [Methylobacterium nonmethylotrophicum]|uniref:Nitrogen assimilation transcriptional regulator n=1 Tax=Methylobacterium nonmethylotrophicum TaxID=1141884 RepID=A0A4Z0NSG1_9HYPH|nr:nitrogen assimilation transcriptional regulator NAC [Methylobacterium nonmethylotrophicum]TGD99674.1 nitrogen assimilation transcriptional regulator [Methylobacterium nonmethylotrophicum]
MNFKRLQYFLKIVDIGSMTQAADVLHVAQPALSQQLATLEAETGQQLLVRTTRGVTPTEAGKVLYRHAQAIMRQCDQARVDMRAAGAGLSGAVSIGLAPGTAAAGLALPLLQAMRAHHPGIVPYLNETYGTTLSELVMNGRMDLAVLYGGTVEVHGLSFLPLLREPLYLVGPAGLTPCPDPVPLRDVAGLDLYLPRPYNVVRKLIDGACAGIDLAPRVVAEIESASTLKAVIAAGLGATILPESMAREVTASTPSWRARIVEPAIEAPLALCQSDHLPLSEPAQAVRALLLGLVRDWPRAPLPVRNAPAPS